MLQDSLPPKYKQSTCKNCGVKIILLKNQYSNKMQWHHMLNDFKTSCESKKIPENAKATPKKRSKQVKGLLGIFQKTYEKQYELFDIVTCELCGHDIVLIPYYSRTSWVHCNTRYTHCEKGLSTNAEPMDGE